MQKTYEKQLNRFTAIILIIVLTMADLITIGANFASLAIDMVATSSNNVEFTAYFKDENGEKITQAEAPLNAEKLNMYVDIAVLREGYFNGKIALENSNFNIISITENSFVKKQEGNKVELNQINSGKTVTLEMQIKANTSASMKADMLNKETQVKLEGTYTSSKGTKIVEEKTEGTAVVTAKFVTPENTRSLLETKILTNKICETAEGKKRILQVIIKSKIENNAYPVKTSNIEISLPTEVETAEVTARSTDATSKNITFGDNNFRLNKDESKLQIKLENVEDENGNISFEQNAKDEFVVTCVYDDDKEFKNIEELQKQVEQTGSNTQITEEDLKEGQVAITQEFLTYDNKTLKADQKVNITQESYGLINYELIKQESEIYKGKIYSGEERTYNLNIRSYANSTIVEDNIAFSLDETSYLAGEKKSKSKIKYKEIRLRKEEFSKVLGDNGYINITTKEGTVISSITNKTQANEDGIIVVSLPEETYELTIQTNKVVSTGKIDFMVTKSIIETEYTQDEIKKFTGIENTVTEINMTEKEAKITSNTTLKETDTNINVEVSTNKISAGKTTNVEIKTTLVTKNESDDLYKNSTVKIYFPEAIEKVTPKYKMLYGNGLEIKEQGTVKEENGRQVLEIKLEGEQSKYPGEAIDGTVIVVNADMEVDRLQTSKIDYVDVAVTNENAKTDEKERKQSKKVVVIQEQSMIVTNNIKELGVETVGKEDDKEVTIKSAEELAKETVEIGVKSNEKDTVNDVKILGKFPTKNSVNTMDIALTSGIKVTSSQKDVKVYYSAKENPTADLENKENGWTEDSSLDGKNSYLIVVPTLENAEKFSAEYGISIKQSTDEEKSAEESFEVGYLKEGNEVNVKATKVLLNVEGDSKLEMSLTATVGGDELKENDEVHQGEVIRYTINLKNNGTKDIENITVTGVVPEGTSLYNTENAYKQQKMTDITNVFENITIKQGETISLSYQVKVNTDLEEGSKIENKVSTNYNNTTKTIVNIVKDSDIIVEIKPYRVGNEKEIKVGLYYQYYIEVTNKSKYDKNNIELSVTSDEIFNIDKNTIVMDKIEPGKTYLRVIEIEINENINNEKYAYMYAEAIDNKEVLRSNVIAEEMKNITANIKLTSTSQSNNTEKKLKNGDSVVYQITMNNTSEYDIKPLIVKDKISKYLTIENLKLNGVETKYFYDYSENEDYNIIKVEATLSKGNSIEITINAKVNTTGLENTETIVNKAQAYDDILYIGETQEEIYYIEPSSSEKNNEENENTITENVIEKTNTTEEISNISGGNISNGKTSDNYQNEKVENGYVITGEVWLDSEAKGNKSSSNEKIPNVRAKLIDVNTGKVAIDKKGSEITAETNREGKYTLANIQEGKYIVIFEYDTSKYKPTEYQKDGVANSDNSDAVLKEVLINGEKIYIAATDILSINENLQNIDLGLVEVKKSNLILSKTVNKIEVTNSDGIKTYDFNDTNLAKVEIASKKLKDSKVSIEYTIRVKNEGNTSGYIKNIIDYVPTELDFDSNINKNWKKQGEYIYNSDLANDEIKPGDTREIRLILTKTMTDSNTGLVSNIAKIIYDEEYSNSTDITDSTNKKEEELSVGQADVIIGIKTGMMFINIAFLLCILIIVFSGVYLRKRQR